MPEDATQPSTNQPQGAPAPSGLDTNAFFTNLSQQLIDQSGIISSTNSELEGSIQRAISGVEESRDLSTQRIESEFGREREFALQEGEAQVGGFLEGRSGFATQMPALRRLVETTDKNLKDLAQRKEELILQNNADAAAQIAQLEFQAIEFRQKAEQQVFTNLLGLGSLGVSISAEQRAGRAQEFQERSAIASIGLEFGVEVGPNDTLESIVAKAAPFASQARQAELARTLADTQRIKAETNRLLQEGIDATSARNVDIDVMAQAYLRDPNVIGNDVSDAQYASIVNRAAELESEQLRDDLSFQILEGGRTKAQVLNDIRLDPSMSAQQKLDNIEFINNNFETIEEAKFDIQQTMRRSVIGTGLSALGLGQEFTAFNLFRNNFIWDKGQKKFIRK